MVAGYAVPAGQAVKALPVLAANLRTSMEAAAWASEVLRVAVVALAQDLPSVVMAVG